MENEIVKPVKIYTVKNWEIRLKSGAAVTYNIREDLGERFVGSKDNEGWNEWQWPAQKRKSGVRESEIAAIDYTEVEMKEIKMYKPKKGALSGEGKDPDSSAA